MSVEYLQLGYNSEDSRAEEVEGGTEVMSVAHMARLVTHSDRTDYGCVVVTFNSISKFLSWQKNEQTDLSVDLVLLLKFYSFSLSE